MSDDREQPDDEDEHRPADEEAADAELDRRVPASVLRDEAGVDETDERDEQADTDRDRGLELRAGRPGTRLSGTR